MNMKEMELDGRVSCERCGMLTAKSFREIDINTGTQCREHEK